MGRSRLVLIILVLTMGASLAEPAPDPYPIYGAWKITRYEIAPWVTQSEDRKDLEAEGAAHLELAIEFAPREVISRDPVLGCAAATYEPTSFPPEAIFQGNLPEPDQGKLARALGFPEGYISGFDLDCSTGLFSYHFADADTLLFALSDVVYWLTRQARLCPVVRSNKKSPSSLCKGGHF